MMDDPMDDETMLRMVTSGTMPGAVGGGIGGTAPQLFIAALVVILIGLLLYIAFTNFGGAPVGSAKSN